MHHRKTILEVAFEFGIKCKPKYIQASVYPTCLCKIATYKFLASVRNECSKSVPGNLTKLHGLIRTVWHVMSWLVCRIP